jgi:glutamyl-tRNA synthetase
VTDLLFGDVVIAAAEQEDFVIQKDDGYPTYHLANVIDDGLMGVTHILRGQEFLGQTWRQTLLRKAMGFPEPQYAHLPLIMDMAGRKLSKRDGDVELHAFRVAGYLPEALIGFIALLGWNPGRGAQPQPGAAEGAAEQEEMTVEELKAAFALERLGKTNAKFDRAKLLAFNTDFAARATPERLLAGLKDFLALNMDKPGAPAIAASGDAMLHRLLTANKGFRTFADILSKTAVLFGADDAFAYDDKAVAKVLAKNDEGYAVLRELRAALATADWSDEAIKAVIDNYCQSKALGMNKVAQPLRVATTGNTVSPMIVDTLVILGKDKTLARIDRCLAAKP